MRKNLIRNESAVANGRGKVCDVRHKGRRVQKPRGRNGYGSGYRLASLSRVTVAAAKSTRISWRGFETEGAARHIEPPDHKRPHTNSVVASAIELASPVTRASLPFNLELIR